MNKRIAELMELNKAVDVICAEVEKTNEVKREQIKGNYRDRWNAMFDDLDEIIPVVNNISKVDDRIGKYKFGYPYGFNYLSGEDGVTFIRGLKTTDVYVDIPGGWRQIRRDKFESWYRACKETVETLLDNWRGGRNLYGQIEKDLEERLAASIRRKVEECRKTTEELDLELERGESK